MTAELSRPKPKSKAARAAGPSDDQFSVAQYLLDEVELPWDQLSLDVEMKHGQIRQLNVLHRDALVEQFETNPPMCIELITILEQGVYASILK